MDNVINLKINGKEVTAVKGQTILQVASANIESFYFKTKKNITFTEEKLLKRNKKAA